MCSYNHRDVSWVGKTIVLFGAVVVQEPYGPRNVGVLDVDAVKKTRVEKATFTGTADQVKAQVRRRRRSQCCCCQWWAGGLVVDAEGLMIGG